MDKDALTEARIAYFKEKKAVLERFKERAVEEASARGEVLSALD